MQEDNEKDVQHLHLEEIYSTFKERRDELIEHGMEQDMIHAEDFIEDLLTANRVILPKLCIDTNTKEISFLFGIPGDIQYVDVGFMNGTWHYYANIKGNNYFGDDTPPAYIINERKYYDLPTEIVNGLRVPDLFDIEYDMLPNTNLVWCNDWYDGPLSGICENAGKFYYFVMVDQTKYTGNRMFAVYDLPTLKMLGLRISQKLFEFFQGYGYSFNAEKRSKYREKPQWAVSLYWKIIILFGQSDLRDFVLQKRPIGHFSY